ncbi:MAG: cation transporter [Lachnospiraceae bacterium]|nr:cation transporter [Lachnospiraceae bacterium]
MVEKTVMRISTVSIAVNLILSVGKLLAGVLSRSGAMVSDAIHSASDVFSTIIVMVGIHLSEKKADAEHPYGHERMECVAALLLAVVLAMTGGGIGINGVRNIVSGSYADLAVPGRLALVAAVLSIVVKEWMYHYTVRAARKIRSAALKADAWHHRSDALSSVGALIGIAFAQLGYLVMDSAASVVICLFILKAAYDIFRDAVDKMVDHACDPGVTNKMRETIIGTEQVQGIRWMKSRLFGSRIYLDVAIEVAGDMPLSAAHEVAAVVHHRIEQEYPDVKHCMVHVDPAGE